MTQEIPLPDGSILNVKDDDDLRGYQDLRRVAFERAHVVLPSVRVGRSQQRPKFTMGRNKRGKPHFTLYAAADEHARRAMEAYALSCEEGGWPEEAALIRRELKLLNPGEDDG